MKSDEIIQRVVGLGLDESLAEDLFALGEKRTFKTQENVIDLGAKDQNVYYIIKGGFVCQFYDTNSENLRAINFFMESFHPFMYVPESYFNNTASTCQIKAVRASEVLIFKKKNLRNMQEQNSAFSTFYYNQLVKSLLVESDLRIQLLTQTPEYLYKQLLENYPEVVLTIPSKYIAEYLGISKEWLSKLKHRI